MAKGWTWRGDVAYYDFWVNGKRYQGSLKIKKSSGKIDGKTAEARCDEAVQRMRIQMEDRISAQAIWDQTKRRISGNKKLPLDAEYIWPVYKKYTMTTACPRRQILIRHCIKHFVDWIKLNHAKINDISEVTSEVAKEYIINLREADGAPATKNEKLNTLKALFSSISADYGIVENPFAGIKPLPLRGVARNIYTPEQIQKLFSAEGWLYQLFVTALCTFQREEDCCLIKKSYIQLDRNHIVFPLTYKTGVPVDLPMLPRFRKLVDMALAENNDSEYLFPELARLYQTNSGRIGKEVKKFLAEKGISNALLDVEGYARRVSVLDVHSIRHTAAVIAVLMGWPIPMVMKATGHKTLSMVMRYINHISDEQKESYFNQFGRALSSSSINEEENPDARKRLAELAYSLPIKDVNRLLQLSRSATQNKYIASIAE